MTRLRSLHWLLPLLLTSATNCTPIAADVVTDGSLVPGHTSAQHVRLGDWTRDYLLHVPGRAPYSLLGWRRRYPLVIVLHGSGARGETIRKQSGMDSVAESRHFLVAYPDGSGEIFGLSTDWNAGQCCGGPHFDKVNDVAFLRAVIADVSGRLPVDARRIYIAGFSDGARMAYRAACEMADELTAVAAVSGNLVDDRCHPSRPLPIVAFHGTSDNEVPFDDSSLTAPPHPAPADAASLPPTVRFWLATDRCRGTSASHFSLHVVLTTGVGCTADVAFYSIAGGGHSWPTGTPATAGDGEAPEEIQASPVIADFFLRQRR